jgi:hypothetical protein
MIVVQLIKMLQGKNESIPPLKVSDCVCFVKDNRQTMRKLNPRVVKYIFVGYSST